MKSIGYERLGRLATGALMLLVVQGLGLVGPARASCNHQVSTRYDRHLGIYQLDELILRVLCLASPGEYDSI